MELQQMIERRRTVLNKKGLLFFPQDTRFPFFLFYCIALMCGDQLNEQLTVMKGNHRKTRKKNTLN
jgi:hypothetical protein